jgi:hypothetical protein
VVETWLGAGLVDVELRSGRALFDAQQVLHVEAVAVLVEVSFQKEVFVLAGRLDEREVYVVLLVKVQVVVECMNVHEGVAC